ncbi:MAG: sigma-54-dependent Fis family transcriptional regulator, partial [Gemmatimonadales bacterium]|nr:sigma-54-dependent Fis family transcriptional regulator [Gemmatimonadales bacterium]
LLKAVEERTVRRVGGIRDRRIDVRILAATNRDLERETERERFRRDLYFRLAVILLHLPPLRERGDDILFLADHFLSRFAAKYGKSVSRIDGAARELLRSYPWPGNVRELSHVIERAVLWSRGTVLDAEHLSLNTPALAPFDVAPAHTAAPPGGGQPALPPPGLDLERWERSLIEQALLESDGNQTRAAQRLGISRDTLRYRLKKFGLQA